jgi:LacI family repressor for deo operon, udp, cdd, tsx, nupC, and nupG
LQYRICNSGQKAWPGQVPRIDLFRLFLSVPENPLSRCVVDKQKRLCYSIRTTGLAKAEADRCRFVALSLELLGVVMPVSLREVAARAGVASGTVSSVLNNRSVEARISLQTQERVRRIATEMGYQPNRLAQSLGKGRTNIIGLMIPGLRNPFFINLMELAEERAFQAGYDVLPDMAYQLRSSYEMQGKLKGKLSGWPVDGFLIWLPPDQKLSDYLGTWSAERPVVYLGYRRDDDADFVALDREQGVRQLMEHLRERGCRRIAYLYPWTDLQPVDSRYVVYCDLCAEMGLKPEQILLELLDTPTRLSQLTQAGLREAGLKTGLSLASRLAAERPDAVVCHNDFVAIGLFHGLRRGGIDVPNDIAVAGFDGIDEGMYLDKPLTTVVSPSAQIIDVAFDILVRRLDGLPEVNRQPQQIVLPSTLRVGQTT